MGMHPPTPIKSPQAIKIYKMNSPAAKGPCRGLSRGTATPIRAPRTMMASRSKLFAQWSLVMKCCVKILSMTVASISTPGYTGLRGVLRRS